MVVLKEGDQLGVGGNRAGELYPAPALCLVSAVGNGGRATGKPALPRMRALPIDQATGIASGTDSAAAANGSPGPCCRHPPMASPQCERRCGTEQGWREPVLPDRQRAPDITFKNVNLPNTG
jgi:hypothetical protein